MFVVEALPHGEFLLEINVVAIAEQLVELVLADRTGSDFDRFDVATNGDIILTDTINRAIDRVDPTTGTRTRISSGGLIDESFSFSVTVTNSDRIFVLNLNNPSVIEIDPMTGSQTTVLPVGILTDANDIESARSVPKLDRLPSSTIPTP